MDTAAIAKRTAAQVRALPWRGVPPVRAIRKALSAELRQAPARDVVAIGTALTKHLPRWLGYEIITKHRAALASLKIKDVEHLGILDSWYATDGFGGYISGPAWRDGQIKTSDIKRWAKSKDFWWRRAALVSTVPLNQKSHGNGYRSEDTLAICEMLIDDREDMVVKALSWALRVLAARDPNAVRAFLDRHVDRLAARVKRETNTKLVTGRKNNPAKKAKGRKT
ncbi:MAG TPA: DNA alkylation repair protein [Rhizomicrobium sp.]